MTWKKYFKPVNSVLPTQSRTNSSSGYASASKFNSWLPEIYQGPPDRLQRYNVYETMDLDHEIHAALDTLADFSTEEDNESKLPFVFEWHDDPTPAEVTVLEKALKQWCILNEWNKRVWGAFRGTLMYGDQFFIRDPETYKLFWVDPNKVMKVVVNESEGKKLESFYMRDLDLNLKDLVATNQQGKNDNFGSTTLMFSPPMGGGSNYTSTFYGAPSGGSDTFESAEEIPVDAAHVVQLTMSDGLGPSWPFGLSVLEYVYKVYKQKELLEDSILIYRVHRAPERRVFFIDVGTMPPNKAQQYLERVRYEVQQKRIPSRTGGGENITDSSYNPMCLDLSTKIPLLDGRKLDLNELIKEYESGKENWTYSCDPITGSIVPGNITWAGITKRDAPVIEIELDNGRFITCTPDHKIPVLDKGFVEAQDLVEDDPIISFETKQSFMGDDMYKTYTQVYDHEVNRWVFTDRMIEQFFKGIGLLNPLAKPKKRDKITEQQFKFSRAMVTHLARVVNHNNSDRLQTIALMNKDDTFIKLMQQANPYDWGSTKSGKFTNSKLTKMYKEFNYVNWRDFKRKSKVYNHRIVSVKPVANRDVGTLTIDYEEKWHSHHTFATDAGIFVKNSMLEDYFFAVTCLSLKTKVPLLDGRELTIAELIAEYKDGKENYTYSQNPDMKLEPGKIVWAGVTRKDTRVVRVHLDNGEHIDATPDHRFIMRDGSEVEAQYLNKDDSLMPLYLTEAKTSPKQKGKPYMRYIDNADGKIKWVHTAISPKAKPGRETEIHHIDFNSRNNNPTNLVEMKTADHRQLHKDAGTYSIKKQWCNPESREKLLAGMKALYENRTPEFDKMLSERNRKNGAAASRRTNAARKLVFTDEMLDIFKSEYTEHGFMYKTHFANHLSDHKEFKLLFIENNPNRFSIRNRNIAPGRIVVENIDMMVKSLGYNNYVEFKEEYNYNHKVVSVEWLPDTEDTGDITVETASGSHVFATSAGVFVHNSDGRGSKVETLPGGENLGEIDDLKYFNNKMLRALGVPSSYLPTGPDDGTASYNDGRVGTAFIQEFRFSKICERYQKHIIRPLDEEFKIFLQHRGITIDNSLFSLKFTPPQNFSEYRQLELDAAQINVFSSMADIPYISKRFALKRYLGLSDEEITENEKMWREEKGTSTSESSDVTSGALGDVGITPSGIEDMAPEDGFEEPDDLDAELDDIDISDDEIETFGEE